MSKKPVFICEVKTPYEKRLQHRCFPVCPVNIAFFKFLKGQLFYRILQVAGLVLYFLKVIKPFCNLVTTS